MSKREVVRELNSDQLESISGGASALGIYKPGAYVKKAKAFFRECVGDEVYGKAMNCDAGRLHHYVPARAFLNQSDWEKFCWIEQYGTLDSFPGSER